MYVMNVAMALRHRGGLLAGSVCCDHTHIAARSNSIRESRTGTLDLCGNSEQQCVIPKSYQKPVDWVTPAGLNGVTDSAIPNRLLV